MATSAPFSTGVIFLGLGLIGDLINARRSKHLAPTIKKTLKILSPWPVSPSPRCSQQGDWTVVAEAEGGRTITARRLRSGSRPALAHRAAAQHLPEGQPTRQALRPLLSAILAAMSLNAVLPAERRPRQSHLPGG